MVRFDQGAGGGGEQDGRWKMDDGEGIGDLKLIEIKSCCLNKI
jgi:hypothetical protein